MPTQYHTLVFGNGECARSLAMGLSGRGLKVAMAVAAPVADKLEPPAGHGDTITSWAGTHLIACQGQPGDFQLTVEQDGRRMVQRAGSIVVAEQPQQIPNFAVYGLSSSGRVLSISQAEAILLDGKAASTSGGAIHILFLNDWNEHCHPVTAARMLRLCKTVQQLPNRHTVYMAGHLKVSVEGMEACCQAAKAAGTMFFKFDRQRPQVQMLPDGRVQASCWDDTTRITFTMTFDYVVVDEKITPNSTLDHLSRVLRLDRDLHGFVQSDNVQRLSNATNRRGIFAAGGARAVMSPEEQLSDAAHAALKVSEFLAGLDKGELPRVEIDTARCARCLTCYRLCPHGAIEMLPRMTVMPQACQSCGLCMAGCPNRAIQVHDDQLTSALQQMMTEEAPRPMNGPFIPRLVAFCCRRSALPARDMAVSAGHRLPDGLVVVEGLCGGRFSVTHMLSALEAGADGVLVLTCHPGNCHSECGPTNASRRVDTAAQALALADIGAERLHFGTLAANMGAEFARTVEQFAQRIASLGPVMSEQTMRRS